MPSLPIQFDVSEFKGLRPSAYPEGPRQQRTNTPKDQEANGTKRTNGTKGTRTKTRAQHCQLRAPCLRSGIEIHRGVTRCCSLGIHVLCQVKENIKIVFSETVTRGCSAPVVDFRHIRWLLSFDGMCAHEAEEAVKAVDLQIARRDRIRPELSCCMLRCMDVFAYVFV